MGERLRPVRSRRESVLCANRASPGREGIVAVAGKLPTRIPRRRPCQRRSVGAVSRSNRAANTETKTERILAGQHCFTLHKRSRQHQRMGPPPGVHGNTSRSRSAADRDRSSLRRRVAIIKGIRQYYEVVNCGTSGSQRSRSLSRW